MLGLAVWVAISKAGRFKLINLRNHAYFSALRDINMWGKHLSAVIGALRKVVIKI